MSREGLGEVFMLSAVQHLWNASVLLILSMMIIGGAVVGLY
jgi:hypothetical protein